MKKGTLLGFVIIVLLVAGCGGENQAKPNGNTSTVAVQVKTVIEKSTRPVLSASGKIEAVHSADLSTRMMGYVDKIHVQIGDKVLKGQLLLGVNNTDISARLAQANANITEANAAFFNAEKDMDRYTNLFRENSASQKELDDITAQYRMAKARLEAAEQMKNQVNAELSYTNIRAPFHGTITNRFIKEGDMATPGKALLEMESPGHYQVLAMVPESEIQGIKTGMEVEVILKSINRTVQGKVTEVSTSAKNTGGQYMVKVLLKKSNVPLLSGMFTTIRFPLEEKVGSGMVLIPKEALMSRGQLSGVYTISQSDTAMLRWLRLGRAFGDSVEVLSGLAVGERYIVSAQGKLYNGAKIVIR